MTRKNIFEILESKYNISKEMKRIVEMFNSAYFEIYDQKGQKTYVIIESVFEKYIFPLWKQRAPFLSCQEMRKALNLPKRITRKEDMLRTLEYYVNIITWLNRFININAFNLNFQYPPAYNMLCGNIALLLKHLNYREIIFEQEQKVILVPCDAAATAASELSSRNTAFAILKYHHGELKGNLEEKRALLYSIAQEYEALLEKGVVGFKDYFDKANALLNNLNIRHNNKTGKNKKDLVTDMLPAQLEKWYDELYQLLLFCILIKDNTKRKDEMAELLKKLKKK